MLCPLKAKPRWTRRKDARPQELVAAALDLFVERGYAATRLDDVAAQAGVSKGTLYLYFTNKEDLFKAVVRENVLPVLGEAEETIRAYQGPSTALFRELMLSWWERIGSTKAAGIAKLIMAESCNFPGVAAFYHEEVISRAKALLVSMLNRGIERGEFRPIDPAHATDVVMAPMIMLMLWKHSFGACSVEPIDPKQYLDCYIALMLQGLCSDGQGDLPAA